MATKHRSAGSDLAEHAHSAAQDLQESGAAVWDRAKDIYASAQNGVISGAKTTDRVIRQNPYQAVGIAFGVGLLIGFLVKRK
jgi:ElaB/YqjD/DUF883 family membrane-anchored ribosome-binding protein